MSKRRSFKALAILCLGLIVAFSGAMLAACDKGGKNPQKVTYQVTFDSQGGSAVEKQTVEKGGKVTEPAEPSYDKHEFIGWYKESACTNEWKFAEDTVNSDITLYAKWEKVPAEITWEVGEMPVIYSDAALYNKTRATEDVFTGLLSGCVTAKEDGVALQTIVGDIGGLARNEETGLIEAKDYTITYQAQDSEGKVLEKEVTLTVKDAEKTNYYVEFKSARGGKGMEEVVGTRIRVAENMYFESTETGELPEALKNPHAEGKLADYDDPFILKNISDKPMTVNLQDSSATYLVFEKGGKVVWGFEGVMAYVIDEDNMFPTRTDKPTAFEVPAKGYALVVGYTQNGNWYAHSTDGKKVEAGDYWGDKEISNMWDIDGRQMTYMDGMYRYGNMVRITRNNEVVTDAYENQLPYIMKGTEAYQVVVNTALTKEDLLKDVAFYDDNGTFAPDVQTDKVAIDDVSFNAINTAQTGDYTVKYIVTDATDSSLKYEYVRDVKVIFPEHYVQFGDQLYNEPDFSYNQAVASNQYEKWILAYDNAYKGEIKRMQFGYTVVIDKTTGALVKFADWSKIYQVADGKVENIAFTSDQANGKVQVEFFAELGDNELMLVFENGTAFRAWFYGLKPDAPEKAFLTDAAKFAETKFIIKDMAGINIPAAE